MEIELEIVRLGGDEERAAAKMEKRKAARHCLSL